MRLINIRTKAFFISVSFLLMILGLLIPVQQVSAQKKKSNKKPVTTQGLASPRVSVPEIIITQNRNSLYRIVIPSSATAQEQKAAAVLQDYLLQISGAALPIISAAKPGSSHEIILGQNERLDALGIGVNFNELEADGFVIKTDSLRLIIAGGNDKGTLFGVYTFLEKYLGCRMYAPKVKIIPERDTIILGKIDDREIPKIKYRTINYKTSWDEEYVDWHKLNHDAEGERPAWGTWVHTFNHLVPPEVYFNDHPEYYSG